MTVALSMLPVLLVLVWVVVLRGGWVGSLTMEEHFFFND